jgi:Zn-dependent protease
VTLSSGSASFATSALSVLLMFNVIAGTFNLLPLPPLDGSAVISIFLPERLAEGLRDLQRHGAFSMLGLLAAWQIFPRVIDPLFATVLKLVHPDTSYS